MTTKVMKRDDIPAGMFSDVEIFVTRDKKTNKKKSHGLRAGQRIDYLKLPSHIRAAFAKDFWKDRKFVMKKWKDLPVSEAFLNWQECKFGKLNGTPDYNESTGKIIADDNTFCGDCHCCIAGDVCKLPSNLTKEQVATIQYVKLGWKREQIAAILHVSPETIKKRLDKSREAIGAKNAPHLVYLTHQIPAAQ